MSYLLPIILFIAIFDSVFKLIALWKTGRRNQLVWFIVIALTNTAGILPIIYLLTNKQNNKILRQN